MVENLHVRFFWGVLTIHQRRRVVNLRSSDCTSSHSSPLVFGSCQSLLFSKILLEKTSDYASAAMPVQLNPQRPVFFRFHWALGEKQQWIMVQGGPPKMASQKETILPRTSNYIHQFSGAKHLSFQEGR